MDYIAKVVDFVVGSMLLYCVFCVRNLKFLIGLFEVYVMFELEI